MTKKELERSLKNLSNVMKPIEYKDGIQPNPKTKKMMRDLFKYSRSIGVPAYEWFTFPKLKKND